MGQAEVLKVLLRHKGWMYSREIMENGKFTRPSVNIAIRSLVKQKEVEARVVLIKRRGISQWRIAE